MNRRFTIHSVGDPIRMGRHRWQALPGQPKEIPTLGLGECLYYRCTSCPHPAVISITNTLRGVRVLRHPVDQVGDWSVAAPLAVGMA